MSQQKGPVAGSLEKLKKTNVPIIGRQPGAVLLADAEAENAASGADVGEQHGGYVQFVREPHLSFEYFSAGVDDSFDAQSAAEQRGAKEQGLPDIAGQFRAGEHREPVGESDGHRTAARPRAVQRLRPRRMRTAIEPTGLPDARRSPGQYEQATSGRDYKDRLHQKSPPHHFLVARSHARRRYHYRDRAQPGWNPAAGRPEINQP